MSCAPALAEVLADRDEIGELPARSSEHPEDALAARYLVELLIQRGKLAEAERILLARVLAGNKGLPCSCPSCWSALAATTMRNG